jgi:hypothetical protein
MDFRETLRAQLPPSRPDEPARLRQDILDELNDHLVSAYNREILKGADSSSARQRVLEQFGDPAALACRLWLDAMKGKIMAQRVLIGTCLVVAAASLASLGIVWQQSVHAQRIAAMERARAEARAEEAARQLRELSEAIKHPRSLDWNPVRIKLTEETEQGPPAVGVMVVLTRSIESPPKTFSRRTDAAGMADFGTLQPGQYSLQINDTWPEGSASTDGELTVQPGAEINKHIVCPALPLARVSVRVRWQWPADLEKEPLLLYAPFTLLPRKSASGERWTISRTHVVKSQRDRGIGPYSFVVSHSILGEASGSISEFKDFKGLAFWRIQPGALGSPYAEPTRLAPGDFADALIEDLQPLKPPGSALEFEVGTYALDELFVVRPSQSRDVELGPGRRRFDLLAAATALPGGRAIQVAAHPPSDTDLETPSPMLANPMTWFNGASDQPLRQTKPTVELPSEVWQRVNSAFEAKPGQNNEWTIPLPEELIQAVRQALKTAKPLDDNKPAAKAEVSKRNG